MMLSNQQHFRAATPTHFMAHHVVVLLITILFLMPVGCRDNNTPAASNGRTAQSDAATNTNTHSNTNSNTNTNTGPQLTFDTVRHDFGQIFDIQPSTYEFQFTNTGNKELIIEDIRTSCGCTVPELEKKRFQPGEGSAMKIEYTPRGGGLTSKSITVTSNDPDDNPIRLTIIADVVPFVEFNPKSLQPDDVTTGETYTTTVDFTAHDPNAEIISVQATGGDGHLAARLLPDPDGPSAGQPHTRKIQVTIEDTAPWGRLYGSVLVRVRGRINPDAEPVVHDARLSVIAQVYGKIRASNNMFRVGTVRSGRPVDAAVKLYRPDGQPFEITNIFVQPRQMPGIQVEKRPLENDPDTPGFGYQLILTGDTTGYTGRVGGTVIVETDVPDEQRLEFRYAGRVR